MMSVWEKILVEYQNSDKILLQKQNSKQKFDFETRVCVDNEIKILRWYQISDKILLRKQRFKQNFDFETRVDVDKEVCLRQNSRKISEFWQNSAAKTKF